MNRWQKVLKAICDTAKDRKEDLYILEADRDMNWFGAPLSSLCSEDLLTKSDAQIYKAVKSSISSQVKGNGYIALVSPVNLLVDIYPHDVRRFALSGLSRPFAVTRDSFRIGFFKDKDSAVEFFIEVGKRLEVSLHLHF